MASAGFIGNVGQVTRNACADPISRTNEHASERASQTWGDTPSIADNLTMQDRTALDRYFTEQVVGEPIVIAMGPSEGVRREPQRGLRLHLLEAQAELLGHAARGLVSPLNGDAGFGQPVSTQALVRARRRLLVLALFAILALWSILLWWIFERVAR